MDAAKGQLGCRTLHASSGVMMFTSQTAALDFVTSGGLIHVKLSAFSPWTNLGTTTPLRSLRRSKGKHHAVPGNSCIDADAHFGIRR
jgi:hypothetical protein